jgi:PAS domain S-box-containing protein
MNTDPNNRHKGPKTHKPGQDDLLTDAEGFDRAHESANCEQPFKRLMDSLPGMVYRCLADTNWTMIFVSEGVQELCGYTAEDLLKNRVISWNDLVHPDDRGTIYQQVKKAIDINHSFHLAYRIITKDGSMRHVWERGKAVHDEETGDVSHLEGFIMDVTDAFLTRRQLEQSEQRFKLFAENASDMIFRMSLPDRNYEYISRGIEKLTGYSATDFYNNNGLFWEIIHPESMDYVKSEWEKLHSDGPSIPTSYEFRIVRRDGSTGWVHQRNTLVRDKRGVLTAIEGIVTDITDLKTTQLALKESRRILLQAQRLGHLANWELDLDTLRFHAAEHALKLTGLTPPSDGRPLRLDDLIHSIHPDDQPRIAAKIKNALMMHEGFEDEWRLSQHDGRCIHVIVTFGRNEMTGKPRCWGTIQDVTAQRDTERKLAQAQKMEAVGRLAGGVAHDFNNLVHIILGYTEMMRTEVTDNEALMSSLDEIQEAGRRAERLIEKLQAFSRKEEFNPEKLSLNNVIDLAEYEIRQSLPPGIELVADGDPELNPINGDNRQLRQIVLNLCSNSIAALKDHGHIIVRTRNVTLDEKFCHADPDLIPGDYVILTVQDDGPGIDEATLDHVFEPFFTTQASNKTAGLGLTIAYAFVREHHGHISAANLPGGGCLFSVYLPALPGTRPEERSETVPPDNEKPVSGGTETILLAEDDDLVCRISQGVLSRMGYKVLIAHDGREALRVYHENKDEIDLLILDIVMPHMNGSEVYQVIAAENPALPVLFSSGYNEEVLRSDFLLQVPGLMVHKPYSNKELLHAVRQVLSAGGTHRKK